LLIPHGISMRFSEVTFEPCKNQHVPQLVELWKEYTVDQVEEDPLLPYFDLEACTQGFSKTIDSIMKKEPEGFLVALLGDQVVGFVVSYKDAFGPNYVTKKRVGNIQIVHVKRGFRRKGVATKLINAAYEYLKANGCSIILAETGEMNKESMQMFRKLGFKQRGKLVAFMKEI